jgi:L-seryl-tRNA(Ser) seleniumtransferase
VIVSRGELIEIGDSFRIPEIMAASGAKLREVGTTNRTSIDDYRAAVGPRTRLLLRVHPSNFRMEGFVARPPLGELAELARQHGLPLYEDLGSGCAVDLAPYGIAEPRIEESFSAGVNLVSFSGDKLLGGPQAGILAGDPALVARLRKSPLYRALRVDKLITQALETTLRNLLFERWDQIPAVHMIRMSAAEIHERAERIRAQVQGLEIVQGHSLAGGGSTPGQALPTWLLVVQGRAVKNDRKLRAGSPPVIARIEEDRLVLDLRTVLAEEEDGLVRALYALSK